MLKSFNCLLKPLTFIGLLTLASLSFAEETMDKASAEKVAQFDQATVVQHNAGKGRYEGILGSMSVSSELNGAFKLSVGFDKSTRTNPPPVGSTIEYRYYGLSKGGKPRYPSFVRLIKANESS